MRPLIALLLLITAGVCTLSDATPRPYENYSVYRVYIKSPSDQQVIDELLEQTDDYNQWRRGLEEFDIMVSPRAQETFLNVMQRKGISVKVIIKNVQRLIDEQGQ
ncbi:uncharacterized protein LOC108118326 [Drosophila eugracilis]|uniref:uncharacterized protein LOC108118326 n=1 Tax=Drosophila eugracilis TaxID=29029 RepID=UPI001BDB274E|nr:uncharacterized protein LOC108118326 [Drosophila eugracilis]